MNYESMNLGETGMTSMQFVRENTASNEVGQSTKVKTPSAKGGKALIPTNERRAASSASGAGGEGSLLARQK